VADYTEMSNYYDLIMTSGYYDYDAIVADLAHFEHARTVLEIGCGTGLILERLATHRPEVEISGIDLTRAMLDIAEVRLAAHDQVSTHQQNIVDLTLDREYDLAFSYGGVWYFVRGEEAGDFSLVSHIRDLDENRTGLERLAAHLPVGGTLLLGIQDPHFDYTRPVTGDLEYAQRITPIDGGFRKRYTLATADRTLVMDQTTDYRSYTFDEAIELLDKCGFEHRTRSGAGASLFQEFSKR
jgi:SAM-dependent methyltransferase